MNGQEPSMQKTTVDPSQWLADLPDDIRADMQHLDTFIVSHLPQASRDLWEGTFWGGTEQTIIGYGGLIMTQPGGQQAEWFMVGLARQQAHFSIYVNALRDGRSVTKEFGPRLGKVKVGAASITFRSLANLELAVLGEVLDIANAQVIHPEQPTNH
jgi:hypothetical protein